MFGSETLPTSALALLGLLSIREMSGYELAAFADKSLGYFWPMHRSLVYRELPRLEDAGYVAGTAVHQQRLPDKRVYRLTDAGRRRLTEWMATPGFESPRYRNEFLVKFFFARLISPEALRQLLVEYREALELDLTDLHATVRKLDDNPDGLFGQLAARHGVHTRQAMLAWISEVEDVLDRGIAATSRENNDR